MELKEMNLEQLQLRLKEIEEVEINKDDADYEALIEEVRSIKEFIANKNKDIEARTKLLDDIAEGRLGTTISTYENNTEEGKKRKMENIQAEYRNAFLKELLGQELTQEEQRAFVHTTENTGAVVPKELQNRIYSTMEEKHPILADIQYLRTGAVLSIVKHTGITAGDAKEVKEGVANDDEQNTFVTVSLNGKDFSKHVDFSYRLGQMAIPAFEDYLVREISNRLASAIAKEVIAQFKKDINTENKISGTATIDTILSAIGSLKQVGIVNVYANNKTIYGSIVKLPGEKGRDAFIPDYANGISGRLLGKAIKEEDSLADNEILIADANQFIFNEVQPLLIERDRNIKTHVHTVSGLIIGEGVLTNDKAASLITVTPAL